ncbi:MAG: hypothetical protein GF388_09205 [Candidatus Aegiribacteria sp.]|nr:hypothetical protein [Candidatus Aegiribacteria sp.]MBD3295234.1 hypothetical protein [Candidatus Fermentibacteria bacterium]
MNKCIAAAAVLLLNSAVPAEILFTDDFSSGNLEENWIFYGDPQPKVIDSLGCTPPCFNNNGDTMWGSGAVTRQVFDLNDGISVECDVFLSCHERGTWVSGGLSIVSPGFRNETSPENYAIALLNHQHNGELAWMRPNLQSIITFGWYPYHPGRSKVELYHQNLFQDGWHSFRIDVSEDRSIDYFIDDSLYYSIEDVVPDTLSSVRILIGGHSSSWGMALHDNLTIRR